MKRFLLSYANLKILILAKLETPPSSEISMHDIAIFSVKYGERIKTFFAF